MARYASPCGQEREVAGHSLTSVSPAQICSFGSSHETFFIDLVILDCILYSVHDTSRELCTLLTTFEEQ